MSLFDFSIHVLSSLVPNHCSEIFYGLIEALFITHAQTKLNVLGHLDGMLVQNETPSLVHRRMKTRFQE